MEGLKIGDTVYQSRLLIGTAGYPNFDLMMRSLEGERCRKSPPSPCAG